MFNVHRNTWRAEGASWFSDHSLFWSLLRLCWMRPENHTHLSIFPCLATLWLDWPQVSSRLELPRIWADPKPSQLTLNVDYEIWDLLKKIDFITKHVDIYRPKFEAFKLFSFQFVYQNFHLWAFDLAVNINLFKQMQKW